MQAPTYPTTNAQPAALAAVPGTGPSCAVTSWAPLSPATPAIGRRHCGTIPLPAGETDGSGHLGQDGRYRKDQRGRAVARA